MLKCPRRAFAFRSYSNYLNKLIQYFELVGFDYAFNLSDCRLLDEYARSMILILYSSATDESLKILISLFSVANVWIV